MSGKSEADVKRRRELRRLRREQRLCVDCGAPAASNSSLCEKHRDRTKVRQAANHQKRWVNDPDYRQRMQSASVKWQAAHPEQARALQAKSKRKTYLPLKIEAVQRYGGRCACCGEADYHFLTFDHANGDGYAHRVELYGHGRWGGSPFVRALARLGWPDVPGLQVMCFNCHMAKDMWGKCPHQAKAILADKAGDDTVEAAR